jgi:hypothetical protein
MNLTYRGISYITTSTSIETSDRPIVGQYRGAVLHFAEPQTQASTDVQLSYRGATYLR